MKKNAKIWLFPLLGGATMCSAQQNFISIPEGHKWPAPLHEAVALTGFEGSSGGMQIGQMMLNEAFQQGTTYFDLQSNYSGRDLVLTDEWGTTVAWTHSNESSPFSDRGTVVVDFDGNAWQGDPATRIESERTGWGGVGRLADGTTVALAHGPSGGLRLSKKPVDGSWSTTTIPALSDGTGGDIWHLWPRVAVGGADGNTIHAISLTAPLGNGGILNNGQDGALVYMRSTDGGDTWDTQLFSELDVSSFAAGFVADSYVLHAHGDKVAFAVFNGFSDTFVMVSEDNGETWTYENIVDFPIDNYIVDSGDLLDASIADDVDVSGNPMFFNADRSGDVLIDADGEVHVFFGRMYYSDSDTTDGTTSYYPYTNGLEYWNSTMGPDTTVTIAYTYDMDGNGSLDFEDEIAGYYVSISSQPSACLLTESNTIIVAYSALMENFTTGVQNYRHIHVVQSDDGGVTWNTESACDITPDSDFELKEAVFPHLPARASGSAMLPLLYMEDVEPGLHVRGDEDPIGPNSMVVLPLGLYQTDDCASAVQPAYPSSLCYGSGMFESEDFECYAAGDLIGQSNVHWNTWSLGQEGLDMDVPVQASSNGTQALHVEQTLPEGGVDDVILRTERTTGYWSLTWDMFLEPDHSAYFNLQGTDTPGGVTESWQLNAYLSADGSLALDGPWGTVQTAIGATAGEWFELRLLCSMETGLMKLLANGEEVLSPVTLAGHMAWINFFGSGDGTTTGDYWVDNVVCQPFEPFGCTDSGAPNYTADALVDDGSCITVAEGECAELFISEYVEGWSNNKAIEIYNPTSNPIDMSDYRLERYSNGATAAADNQKVDLMGTVMPGDVLVYVLDKQDPDGVDFEAPVWDDLAAAADFWLCPIYEENNMMYFNGNDALVLRKISTNAPIDIFGIIGNDPGVGGWDGITQNHTLVRRPEILEGDVQAIDAFDVLAVWDSLPANTFDQLGFHSCFCTGLIDPEEGCTDPNAANYNPLASVDDGSCMYLDLSCANIGTAAFDDAGLGFYPPQSSGVVGVPYSGSMALHVPGLITEDGTGTTYSVATFIPDGWSGEVPGLATPSVPDALDGNDQLCLDLEGLPEQAGVFAMTLSGELFISVFGTSFSAGTFSVTHIVVVEENPNPIPGCTYSGASNYSVLANDDDGSCLIEGCTDPVASNYHPIFNADNGSCLYGCDGSGDPLSDICNSDINDDLIVSVADLIILLGTFGLICTP